MSCHHDCAQGDECSCGRRVYLLADFVWVALAVLAIAAVTSWLGPALDDVQTELAVQQSLVDAQKQAQAELRRDLAAAALCRHQHGEAGYTWNAAGQLVCIPRRGKTVLAQVP
jgi:hypothetical protein